MKMRVLLTSLLVASLVLAACGPKEAPSPPTPVAPQKVEAPSQPTPVAPLKAAGTPIRSEAPVKPPAVTPQEVTVPELDLSVELSALVEELDVDPGTFDLDDQLALVEMLVDIPLDDILKDISGLEIELPDISAIRP